LINGDGGADRIFGGDGQDGISGGLGDDHMEGGGGPDSFYGGNGDQVLPLGESGGGSDVIIGGDGSDSVDYTGPERVTVTLGGGADDGHVGEKDDVQVESVMGGDGPDVLTGSAGMDRLDGGGGDDALTGGDGGDHLQGGAGADAISGEAGDDTLGGGEGADRLHCGDGRDRLDSTTPDDAIDLSCEDHFGQPWGSPPPEWSLPYSQRPKPPLPAIAPVVTAKRVAELHRRRMMVAVKCSGDGTCAGTLTVKLGRRRIGRAAYRVAGGSTWSVRVVLTPSARRSLRGERRVKVEFGGAARAQTVSLELR
jgi:hypothetical protein